MTGKGRLFLDYLCSQKGPFLCHPTSLTLQGSQSQPFSLWPRRNSSLLSSPRWQGCGGPSYTPGLCLPTSGLSPSPSPVPISKLWGNHCHFSFATLDPLVRSPSHPHPNPPAGWPYSLPSPSLLPEDAFGCQRSVFWKAIFQHPCILDVKQGSAHGGESSLSHFSAQPCLLPHSSSSHCDGLSQLPALMCCATAQGCCDLERSSAGLGARIGALAADEKHSPAKIC